MDQMSRVNIYVDTWIANRFRKDKYLKRQLSKITNELLGDYLHGENIKSIKREISEYEQKINEFEIKKLGAKHRIKDLQLAEKEKDMKIKQRDEFINDVARKFKNGKRIKINRKINEDWLGGYMKDVKKNGWDIKDHVLLDYCIAYSKGDANLFSDWS